MTTEKCRVWINVGVGRGWERITKPLPHDTAIAFASVLERESAIMPDNATAADLAAVLMEQQQ
jgi:hypothetical protein